MALDCSKGGGLVIRLGGGGATLGCGGVGGNIVGCGGIVGDSDGDVDGTLGGGGCGDISAIEIGGSTAGGGGMNHKGGNGPSGSCCSGL